MRNSSLRSPTKAGNESIIKKIKAKCQAKEKDKSSTLDTYTKSAYMLRSKKTNTSSAYTNTETTANSQMLCDLSYKDLSIVKSGVPETNIPYEKNNSYKPKRSPLKCLKFDTVDLTKILDMKEKEVNYLEKARISMNDKISQAVEYIEDNKDLEVALLEKEKKIRDLKFQLNHTMQEIDQLNLWKKSTSIPNILENARVSNHSTVKKNNNDGRSFAQRIKSLSPGFFDKTLDKERFRMYTENPIKAILTKYIKTKVPKKCKDPSQRVSSSNIKKIPNKHPKFNLNLAAISNTDGHIKFKKSHGGLLEANTPSPRKRNNHKLKDILEATSIKNEEKKYWQGSLNLRGGRDEKIEFSKANLQGLPKDYNNLLDKYVSLVEEYKDSNNFLQQQNQILENQVKYLNEKVINISSL